MRRVLVLLAVAMFTVSLVPIASAQEDDEIVLRIGLTQDWSTLNPTSGFAVPEYEVWNVHYAPFHQSRRGGFLHRAGHRRIVGGIQRRSHLHLHHA